MKVEIKGGVLTVSGERKAEHEERGRDFYRAERAIASKSLEGKATEK